MHVILVCYFVEKKAVIGRILSIYRFFIRANLASCVNVRIEVFNHINLETYREPTNILK
jgi:hypothetical protein